MRCVPYAERMDTVRVDKWLWAVRIYKTRSEAADACRGSAVRINDSIAKPSAKLRTGDIVTARTSALTRTRHQHCRACPPSCVMTSLRPSRKSPASTTARALAAHTAP